MLVIMVCLTGSAAPLYAQWVQTHGIYGGTVLSLAVGPRQAGGMEMIAGTTAGVFLSTDSGKTWTPSEMAQTPSNILSIVFSSADHERTNVFGGTNGGGVYLSIDDGKSWKPVNSGLTNPHACSLVLSPGDSDGTYLYAGTYGGGVFLTTDRGENWRPLDSGLTSLDVTSLAIGRGRSGGTSLYAGTWGGGVFLSTNSGASWAAINAGLTKLQVSTLLAVPTQPSGTDLYAGTYYGGVFRSTDDGTSWRKADSGMTYGYVKCLAFRPDESGGVNLFAGTLGSGVFLSTDNGASWSAVNSGSLDPSVYQLAILGAKIFAGTSYGGVFLSTNNGTTWNTSNTGLENPYVGALSFSANGPGGTELYAGTQGAGIYLSIDNGSSWKEMNTGLTDFKVQALTVIPDGPAGRTLFAGTQDSAVFVSTNHGASWAPANSGLHHLNVQCFAVSPNVTGWSNIFAGASGSIYLSSDVGANWRELKSSIGYYVTGLAAEATVRGGTNVYAAKSVGVYLSTDMGTNWREADSGLTDRYVRSISTCLLDGHINLITGTNSAGVFLTTNNGRTWTAANGGLPRTDYDPTQFVPVRALAPWGANLFAGTTGSGVYLSTNNGTSWIPVNSALTNMDIRALTVRSTPSGEANLFAGTWGGGVYRLMLSRVNDVSSMSPLNPPDGGRRVVLANSEQWPGSIDVSWKYSEGVLTTLNIHFELSVDSTFTSGLLLDSTVITNYVSESRSVRVSHLASGTKYYWRVSMVHPDGTLAPWSNTWAFTTAGDAIGGVVFDDANRNGSRDRGENGISDWLILLSGKTTGNLRTDNEGQYMFVGLDSGSYAVTVVPRFTSWALTYPDTNVYLFTLGSDSVRRDINFGWNYPWNSIGGHVFEDLNENGRFDSLIDNALPRWSVRLSGYESKSETTDAHGSFLFQRLSSAYYHVGLGTIPQNWETFPSGLDQSYDITFSAYDQHPSHCDFAVHHTPPRVKVVLTVTDNLHIARREIRLGVRVGATYGIWGIDTSAGPVDYQEGEFEIPPILPGMFDVRFVDPAIPSTGRFGLGGWTDMRPYFSQAQADSYRIRFQPGTINGGNYPMTISWSRAAAETCYDGPVIMRDRYRREFNLKLSDSVVISDSTITWLQLVATAPVMPPSAGVPATTNGVPGEFRLWQNYPNPFNPSTTINYGLPARSHVTVKIYNLLGQEIATLVDEVQNAGYYARVWNSDTHTSSGVYYYRLQAGSFVDTKKLVLLR